MQFFRDTFQMLLWRGVAIVLGALTAVLIARWLGPVDRGVFALMILWVGLAALVLQFGIPEASIYLLGAKVFPAEQILSTVLAYFCVAATVGGGLCFAVAFAWIDLQFTPSLLLAAWLAVSVLVAGLRHFLLAHQQFGRYSLSVVVEGALYLAALAAVHATTRLSVELALGAYVLALCGASLLLFVWLPRGANAPAPRHLRAAVLRQGAQQGMHLFATGLGGFGVQRIGYLLLDWLAGPRAVGLFAAASALPVLFSNLPQQLATVLFSHVSAQGAERGALLTTAVFKLLAIAGIVVLAPVYLLREWIAVTLFGAEFAGIGNTIAILCAGMLMTGLVGVLFNALAGTGSARYGAWLTGLTLLVMSTSAWFLIPWLGLEGAALAQCLAASISLAAVAVLFCRKLSISPRTLLVPTRTELRGLLRAWRAPKVAP